MPEENDWILNGLGFDPSLVRITWLIICQDN
jgi:hypothetical protein